MQADAGMPLRGHEVFATSDPDEAREKVAQVFCPHRLDPVGRQAPMAARHHHLPGERLSLNYIQYGAKTLIAPWELGHFYLVQIPIAGGAAIVNGTDRYYSSPRRAAVLNPHRPTTMIWAEGTRQILVQIDRSALEDHLAAQVGAQGRPVGDGLHGMGSSPGGTVANTWEAKAGSATRRLVTASSRLLAPLPSPARVSASRRTRH